MSGSTRRFRRRRRGRFDEQGTSIDRAAAPLPGDAERSHARERVAIYNIPKVRAAFYQLLLLMAVLWFGLEFALNARANLDTGSITSGFGFLQQTAGFGISQTLVAYSESDTYGRVLLVGLLNTLLVAGLGIVFATLLGFVIGIARLSRNWLVSRLAGGYVEIVRNLPLLLQLLFWYNAVLKALPGVRESIAVPGGGYLNNRGLFLPRPEFGPGFGMVVAALLIGLAAAVALGMWARRRQTARKSLKCVE